MPWCCVDTNPKPGQTEPGACDQRPHIPSILPPTLHPTASTPVPLMVPGLTVGQTELAIAEGLALIVVELVCAGGVGLVASGREALGNGRHSGGVQEARQVRGDTLQDTRAGQG